MVGEDDYKRIRSDSAEEVTLNEKLNGKHLDALVTMLSRLAENWDGRLGTLLAAKLRVKTDPPNSRHVHSTAYLTGSKSREFEKKEIKKIFLINVIQFAQLEWGAPILFAPKRDGFLRFCLDYR